MHKVSKTRADHKPTTTVSLDKDAPAGVQRRELVSALLGAMGVAAAASACTASDQEPERIGNAGAAVTGTGLAGTLTLMMTVDPTHPTIILSSALPVELAGRIWLALDPYTTNCEIVRVNTISGTTVNMDTAWPPGVIVLTHNSGSRVAVLEDIEVTPQLFGAACDGTTDDGPAFNAALKATGRLFVPPGTYAIATTVNVNVATSSTNAGMRIRGASSAFNDIVKRSRLIASSTVTEVLTLGDTSVSGGPPHMVTIEDLLIDGGGTASVGVHVQKTKCAMLLRLTVQNCTQYGYFVDGVPTINVNEVVVDSCDSSGNGGGAVKGAGFCIRGPASLGSGSFCNFLLSNCQSTNDYVCCHLEAVYWTQIRGCQFQGATTNGIEVVNSGHVNIDDTYIEVTGTTLKVTGSFVRCRDSAITSFNADGNSTVVSHGSVLNSTGTSMAAPRVEQVLGVISDDTGWGPPNQPYGKSGGTTVFQKGFTWIDAYGVPWVCTRSNPATGDCRFVARHGRIIIPCYAYTGSYPGWTNWAMALANGSTIWWPQEDMVVQRVSFAVTKQFTSSVPGGQALGFSTELSATQDDLIQLTADTALVARAVFSAANNTNMNPTTKPNPPVSGTLALLAPAGSEIYMVGTPALGVMPPDGSHITSRLSNSTPSPWTDGHGYLMIEGYYPRYNLGVNVDCIPLDPVYRFGAGCS